MQELLCLTSPTALTTLSGHAALHTPPQLTLADSLLDYFSNVLNAQDHKAFICTLFVLYCVHFVQSYALSHTSKDLKY